MIRSIVRAVALGAVALGSALAAQASQATVLTYDFTAANASAGAYDSLDYSKTSGGTAITLSVYGAHLNDTRYGTLNTVSAATAQTWSGAGLGVLYANDSTSNGTHQIDNVGGGVDFVILQFSQAVTLTNIDRVAYGLTGYSTDSDASYLAYGSSIESLLFGLNTSGFSTLNSGVSSTGSTASSAIWLIGANMSTSDRDDGFKLRDISIDTSIPGGSDATPAVPEPASWAMMIVGFGAVGSALRRRKSALAHAA